MFLANRSRRGRDRYLGWKTASFLLGIGFALLGIGLESRWIVNVAIAIVLAGFGLRFLPQGRDPASSSRSTHQTD